MERNNFATYRLAQYVEDGHIDINEPVLREAALKCVLDLLGAAAAGMDYYVSKGAQQLTKSQFGPGQCAIWFQGESTSLTGAILANSTAASVLDLDDGHRAARGHPGAAVIPAALAAAESIGAGADEFLASVVAGYEVAVRVAAASAPARMGYGYGSGRWTGYGVVAALGRLLKLPADQVCQAFAVAGVQSPNLTANGSAGYSDLMGNDVKEAIPWSAVTAAAAVELARYGLSGPADILDHLPHYNREIVLRDLGATHAIKGVYFKPYSSCRYVHPALAGFEFVVQENKLVAEEIQAVRIHTFQWALDIDNRTDPRNLTEVQYSIPYCIALSALAGSACMLPITEVVLGRPDVVALAKKVELVLDPQLEARCPGETLARVVVEGRGQTFESPVTPPRGEATNPMSWGDLVDKFRVATAAVFSDVHRRSLVSAVESLGNGDISPLLSFLKRPICRI
ncbi:MmgE/PrpD family protein [Cupriavidus sp. PET2-C1]